MKHCMYCGLEHHPARDCKEVKETRASSANSELLSCSICGGRMVFIRGRHPGMDNRVVCPTCMAEKLDDIKDRLRGDYGQVMQAR